jgi:hypothetical protein
MFGVQALFFDNSKLDFPHQRILLFLQVISDGENVQSWSKQGESVFKSLKSHSFI